jgi:hypothetical protein
LKMGHQSTLYSVRPRDGGTASQKGRPAGRETKREAGADDRKEGTMEKVVDDERAFDLSHLLATGSCLLAPGGLGAKSIKIETTARYLVFI